MTVKDRQQGYIDNVLAKYFECIEKATAFDRLHWIREGSHGQNLRIAYWENGTEYWLPWRGLSVYGPGYAGNGALVTDGKWEAIFEYRNEYYAMYWGKRAPIMYKVSGLRDGYRIDRQPLPQAADANTQGEIVRQLLDQQA